MAASVADPPRLRIDSRRRWFPDLRAAWGARRLLVLLLKRDLTVKYRQTILGTTWILILPILSAGLFTFVFGQVAKVSTNGLPYFAFSYAGLLAYNLFSQTLSGAANSIVTNGSMITKIYFPRVILALSQMASSLLNLGMSFGVMLLLIFVYHIGLSLRLLAMPVWLMLAVMLSIGVGLMLTAMSVIYRDVQYVTQALLPLLLFVTPVAYSSSAVPHYAKVLYLLNPLATVVDGCRWSLLGHTQLSGWAVAYTIAATICLLIAGLVTFARLEWKFADVI
jgi:lipopolysaccharide transport system permease protein